MPVTIKGRVISCVQEWYKTDEPARPTTRLLSNLWARNRGTTYDTDAKKRLIATLRKEFSSFALRLKPSSFNSIKSVQDLINHIEAL